VVRSVFTFAYFGFGQGSAFSLQIELNTTALWGAIRLLIFKNLKIPQRTFYKLFKKSGQNHTALAFNENSAN
jgi:hypothetical protein